MIGGRWARAACLAGVLAFVQCRNYLDFGDRTGRGTGDSAMDGGPSGQGSSDGLVGSCNALTCPSGCCTGNVCTVARNNQACGTAGAACAPCQKCYQCSSTGACGLNPNSPWDVICSSATISPSKPLNPNNAWDPDETGIEALPDPFCTGGTSALEKLTLPFANTLTPVWNESITPVADEVVSQSFLVTAAWEVAVIDEDLNGREVVCQFPPALTAADFAAGRVSYPPTQGCTSLTIALVCAE